MIPGFEQPDVDPTVEPFLHRSVDKLLSSAVPSRFFGDSVIVEVPDTPIAKPGEAPVDVHKRIQRENLTPHD